ncbi:hypothetical protein TRFO_15245 [Tritrichomonas foetus]|uniref:Uncharacterized protein n=1 Tax=Tritrichomonas foetus TaxID=1144522 RepID=A0A1J4KXL9_9EUKA|nr:hypothetical protein TRFO_15245 [Tritrichomonas foetus]|eukprot:OHT14444.1 hypothetical protein TRFO_15245 [Tritrichomonas foetus]
MQKATFAHPSGEMYDQNFDLLEEENLYFPTFPPMPTGSLFVEKNDSKVIEDTKINEKEEYSKRCKIWEDLTQTGIIYPLPISLSVHIPAHHYVTTRATRSVNTKANPPLPAANLEIFNKLLNGDDFLDQVVPGFRNVPVQISDYIQKKEHWGSKLVLVEPDPNFYPDYDSYKKALKKWSNMVPCDEIQESSELVQFGLPLSDHKSDQISIPTIERKPKNKNSFDPEFFKQNVMMNALSMNQITSMGSSDNLSGVPKKTKQLDLFEEKRYFLKNTFQFFFDKKFELRDTRKEIRAQEIGNAPPPSFINKSDIIRDFENGTFSIKPELTPHLHLIANLNNMSFMKDWILPPKIPTTINVDAQNHIRSLLINIPRHYEYEVFIFLRDLVDKFPSQMISLLCVDCLITPIVKVAELFTEFGFLDYNIQKYTPANINNPQLNELLIFLYGLQTISVLKMYYTTDKPAKKVLEQLNRQYSTLLSGAKDLIKKHFSKIENDLLSAGYSVLHLLLDFCPSELVSVYDGLVPTLGSSHESDFGPLAAHIWTICGQSPILIPNIIHTSTLYIKTYRSLVATNDVSQNFISFRQFCLFLSFLLKFETNSKADITAESVMELLGAVNQLASINTEISAAMATSISKLFTLKLNNKGFKTMKNNFMNSIMAVFTFSDLPNSNLVQLFETSQLILLNVSLETYETFFSSILIDHLKSKSKTVSYAAWSLFRAVSCTADFAKKVSKNPMFKEFAANLHVDELTIPAKTVILLILKKSKLHMPVDGYNSKNIGYIASLFSNIDINYLINCIIQQPKFIKENKIVQALLNGK